MSALWQSMTRPSPSSSRSSSGTSEKSVEIKWLGATSASCSDQNAVMAVRTRPLWVMGSSITTSKAEMRSEVTISSRSSPTA
jgi:hypothetical protein